MRKTRAVLRLEGIDTLPAPLLLRALEALREVLAPLAVTDVKVETDEGEGEFPRRSP